MKLKLILRTVARVPTDNSSFVKVTEVCHIMAKVVPNFPCVAVELSAFSYK
jgi:hypothetical protein